MKSRKAIVVLGMHRSGTSAITRVLNLLGADLPGRLLAPQSDNPTGYWESEALVALHNRILLSRGSSWHDPLPLDREWFGSQEAKSFEDRILELLWEDFAQSRLFVVKDPRISRLVPLWKNVLRRFDASGAFVLTVRNALEVAESLQRRNGFSREKGLLLWLLSTLEAERETRGENRILVSYEDFLRDWKDVVGEMSVELDIEFPKSSIQIEPEVRTFLTDALRHNRSSAEDLERLEGIGRWTAAVYREMVHASGAGAETGDYETLDEIYRAVQGELMNMRPILEEQRSRIATADKRLEALEEAVDRAHERVASAQKATEGYRAALERERAETRKLAEDYEAALERERAEARKLAEDYEAALERERAEARKAIDGYSSELQRLQQEADYHHAEAELYRTEAAARAHYQARLEAVHRSLSWRVTVPLRLVKHLFLQVGRGGPHAMLRVRAGLLSWLKGMFYAVPMSASIRTRLTNFLAARYPQLVSSGAQKHDAPAVGSYPELDQSFRLEGRRPAGVPAEPIEFRPNPQPEASIIVPVFNNVAFTLTCLRSIQETCGGESFEVIVVDDASEDSTESSVDGIPGIRYIRNDKNEGFVKSCNRGAAAARGTYLIFLNNDTVVQQGWLAELLKTVKTEPQAGLVGSQLINEDGSLQEAGGFIWSDGDGWNYGRGADRRSPAFNYLREASYCSGASILVPKQLFSDLEGFDERYAPAYYEDTDLAFEVRRAGRRVLFQPLSRVLHFEGATCGTGLTGGVKRYQVRNRKLFQDKWRDELAALPPGPDAGLDPDRNGSGKVLIIDSYTPMPDKDSGSVDAFFLMKALKSLSYAVTFIPDDNLTHAGEYTGDLQRIGVRCLYRPFIANTTDFLRDHGREFDVVMLTRVDVANRHIDGVRKYCKKAQTAFITVDLHYLRQERQAETLHSRKLQRIAQTTKARELAIMRKVNLTVLKSPREQQLVANELVGCRTAVLPLIIDAPNRRRVAFQHRKDFLFIGSFQHPPNGDAVHYFVDQIWPLVRRRLPDATVRIVGSHMPADISGIQRDGVDVVGHVKDISVYFNRTRVFVAPLRFGAGVKGKVGRSLAYGVPCVATSVAVEGMGLTDGGEAVVADGVEAFADACAMLYGDEDLWNRISDNGVAFFERELSVSLAEKRIRALMEELGMGRDRRIDTTDADENALVTEN